MGIIQEKAVVTGIICEMLSATRVITYKKASATRIKIPEKTAAAGLIIYEKPPATQCTRAQKFKQNPQFS